MIEADGRQYELPSANNVFGYLRSTVGLDSVPAVLRSRMGMSAEQVNVYRSDFDGSQTLRIETATCSLEAYLAKTADTWHFNGAVSGTPGEIFDTLLPIVRTLTWAGYSASFEIYDASFQFVGKCPREEGSVA